MPVTLENLSYIYAKGTPFETAALQNIALTIEEGEFVGLMGRTGCGKSTLISLIAGLLVPASGRVLLDGKDINAPTYDRAELRQKVGVVFQYPEYQLFETTVERDVAFGLRRFGLSKDERQARVRRALETVGFDYQKVRALSPLGLSGGEKRRVAIAGVLAAEPKLLILDEPVAGLDPLGRERFLSLLDRLNAAGTTVLIISHNADALAEHARRILALDDGRLVLDRSAQAFYADTETLAGYGLGTSSPAELASLLRGRGLNVGPVTRFDELVDAFSAEKGGTEK